MRASQAAAHQAPQPLPLPPPPLSLPSPPAAPRRGRHRISSSSSSSSSRTSTSSSTVSSSSSFSFCPSPSPATSPQSLVPFSWERHPGVPKTNSFRGGGGGSPTGAPLPLPPPLRPAPRRRRRRRADVNATAALSSSDPGANSSDPFVAAFAECTRDGDATDHDADDDAAVADSKLWPAQTKPAASSSGRAERRWWFAGGVSVSGGLVGFLDLYGCKSAMAVADSAFLARRPVVAQGRHRQATRR